MVAMRELARRLAATTVTALLTGETGTGKSVLARAIHDASDRADGPFVAVNCGGLPPSLIASELFGHERGAFTGAQARAPGAFRRAHGGTLFLDEIGELPVDVQATLLHALEDSAVTPVGGRATPVDVRVIAATNRDLDAAMDGGGFRRDLLYRLAVVTLHLPPLRERREDIPAILEDVLAVLGAPASVARYVRSAAARDDIAARDWPGNVRELRNWVQGLCVTGAPGPTLEVVPAPPAVPAHTETASPPQPEPAIAPLAEARERALLEFERSYLEALMLRHRNRTVAAARDAGVSRSQLYRLLRRHGLR